MEKIVCECAASPTMNDAMGCTEHFKAVSQGMMPFPFETIATSVIAFMQSYNRPVSL